MVGFVPEVDHSRPVGVGRHSRVAAEAGRHSRAAAEVGRHSPSEVVGRVAGLVRSLVEVAFGRRFAAERALLGCSLAVVAGSLKVQ